MRKFGRKDGMVRSQILLWLRRLNFLFQFLNDDGNILENGECASFLLKKSVIRACPPWRRHIKVTFGSILDIFVCTSNCGFNGRSCHMNKILFLGISAQFNFTLLRPGGIELDGNVNVLYKYWLFVSTLP